jgi:hypothetical protein
VSWYGIVFCLLERIAGIPSRPRGRVPPEVEEHHGHDPRRGQLLTSRFSSRTDRGGGAQESGLSRGAGVLQS